MLGWRLKMRGRAGGRKLNTDKGKMRCSGRGKENKLHLEEISWIDINTSERVHVRRAGAGRGEGSREMGKEKIMQ